MTRMITLAAIVLVCLCGAATAAQFDGIVLDHATGEPIADVTITVNGTGQQTATDSDGRFTLNLEPSATNTIKVTHIGYVPRGEVMLAADSRNVIRLDATVSVLDNVVVTASRYEKQAYKVSQPITTVGSEEIKAKGHALVSDIIRGFPGMDMNDAGPFRARPVIRGLFGTRVLVLVNGERLNDQRDITSFAGVSMSLVDVNEIERVEVVNGPSSVLYGSDAMAGVINIITDENQFASQLTPVVEYSGRYSTADEQHQNRLDVGFKSQRLSGTVGYSYREANSSYQPPDGWNGEEQFSVFRPAFYDSLNAATGYNFSRDRVANSRARIANYDANFSYRLNNQHRLDFDLGVFRGSDIGYPGVPNESTPYWFFYPNHDRDNFSLTYTGKALSDRLSRLEAKIYYQKISKDFLTDFFGETVTSMPFPPSEIALLDNLNRTEVDKYGLNFQELYNLGQDVQLTFGFDALREEIGGQSTSTTRLTGVFASPEDTTISVETGSSVPENDWNMIGLYLSGETRFSRITVTGGLRYDNFWVNTDETAGYTDSDDNPLPTTDEHYDAINGSLGLVYPIGDGVNLIGNVGTAFRVPNVVERFYYGSASGRQTRPNIDIKPEKSLAVDFGVKAIHDRVSYSLIGFISEYEDFTQLVNFADEYNPGHGGSIDTVRLWRYENIDDVTIYGFEGMVEGNLENGLYGNLLFSYQHGQNNTADQPIFVSPIKTSLTAGYRHHTHGLFGEMTVRRVEKQDRVPDVAALDDIPTPAFTVVNATVGARLIEQVRVSLSVKNIFDETYAEPFNARNPDNPIPEPGRNLVLTLSAGL